MAGDDDNAGVGADVVQDGPEFTAEEQAAFHAMQGGESAEVVSVDTGAGGAAVDPAAGTAAAADADAAAAADASVEPADPDEDEDEPAAAAGTKPDAGQPDKRPPRRVPYKRFERAEAERVRLEKLVQQQQVEQARINERMAIINEALTPKQQAAKTAQQQAEEDDPEPELEADGTPKDIFQHNAWLRRQFVRQDATIRSMQEGSQRQSAAQTEYETVKQTFADDAQAFTAEEPNFPEAYTFLLATRFAELAAYHFGKDATDQATKFTSQELARIRQDIAAEERTLVTSAIKAGRSPARAVFAMAKARRYAPSAKPTATPGAGAAAAAAVASNGAAAPAVARPANGAARPAAAAAPSVREEIDRIKNGSEAALSLAGGGATPALALTPKVLADMPEDQFAALLDRLSEDDLRRAMGG